MSEEKKENKINIGGRPPRFKSPEELELLIQDYLKKCEETGEPILVVGFCNYAKIPKSTLFDYKKKDVFSDSLEMLTQNAEECLIKNALLGNYNSSMAQFLAKNNHNYTDKQEIEHSGEMTQKNIEVKWE